MFNAFATCHGSSLVLNPSGHLAYFLAFINRYNKDKQSEKASWWINELDLFGIKKK
jgi:hypothetical protein